MRARKKKHGAERLIACRHLMFEKPNVPVSGGADILGRESDILLEIGCGKGGFACTMAAENPDICFVALEKVSDIVVTALERARDCAELRPDNLRFIVSDAKELPEWFASSSIDTIFLNFSDPWGKRGYEKRRLTHRSFLEMYFKILKFGGKLKFKTDNKGLFDFSIAEIEALGFECDYVTYDLHASEYAMGNIMTEYESNFSSAGVAICSLCVTNKAKQDVK